MREGGDPQQPVVVLKLALTDDPTFDLEKAVCSHGLFMMAPNLWDPSTKTLQRPLRLSPKTSLSARISHSAHHPSSLLISVFGTASLSSQQEEVLLAQVKRMLRISEENDRLVREFHMIHPIAKERGFGRIFRSPNLFEDMVKCILLCNCQWSRTLSMARALCQLQLELKCCPSSGDIHPRTPQQRELKRKRGKLKKAARNLINKFMDSKAESATPGSNDTRHQDSEQNKSCSAPCSSGGDPCYSSNSSQALTSHATAACQSSVKTATSPSNGIGDFPSPEELAALTEEFLAARCGLGYRAKRILLLAQSIVGNKLQLGELEEACDVSTPSSYDKLTQILLGVNGFGPFTCANVLMCMGYYHNIPSDSETVRHLKQFHVRVCSIRTVQKDVEDIYEKYAPFQFLAYWSELWDSYERRFGKLSEMPHSDYQLITASNMKTSEKK